MLHSLAEPRHTDNLASHDPQITFTVDFCLDAILSFAALHMAYIKPHKREMYVQHALQLHERALRKATAILPNVTDENCATLYAFAGLTCFISFAKPRTSKEWGPEISDWLIASRGARTIIDSTKDRIHSTSLSPLFTIGGHRAALRELETSSTVAPLTDFRFITEKVAEPEIVEIYRLAIEEPSKSLSMVSEMTRWGGCETTDVLVWLFRIPTRYFDLVSDRAPESLVILAYFCIVTRELESLWWMEGWSSHLLHVIHSLLDPEYAVWLQWPIEKLGWHPS